MSSLEFGQLPQRVTYRVGCCRSEAPRGGRAGAALPQRRNETPEAVGQEHERRAAVVGAGRGSTRPSRSSRRTIVVIVCLLSRARRAISPSRRPSSSCSGTRIEPYEGRTSGTCGGMRSAGSSFQRWLVLASKKHQVVPGQRWRSAGGDRVGCISHRPCCAGREGVNPSAAIIRACSAHHPVRTCGRRHSRPRQPATIRASRAVLTRSPKPTLAGSVAAGPTSDPTVRVMIQAGRQ
jgi:hypothetical protein